MKTFVAAIVLAGAVAAQMPGIDGLPECAKPCVNTFTSGEAIAGCNQLNIGCICANKSFLDNIACCLSNACSPSDQQAAVAYAKSICSTADVQIPDAVVCPSGGGSTSAGAQSTTTRDSGAPTTASVSLPTTGIPSTTVLGGSATTSTPNVAPAATVGAAGIIGGVIAALLL